MDRIAGRRDSKTSFLTRVNVWLKKTSSHAHLQSASQRFKLWDFEESRHQTGLNGDENVGGRGLRTGNVHTMQLN